MRIERPPLLVLLVQYALYVAAAAAAVAVGIDVGFRLDDPKTITETKLLDLPPACLEIEAELQAARATSARLDAAVDDVLPLSNAYGDAVLSADTDQIDAAAADLDKAKRLVQQLTLDLATDQAALDDVVGNCAPERTQ